MSTDLRAGLIGCGSLGRVHSQALADIGKMPMVAFCDVIQPAAETLAAEFDGEYATTDVDRLLSDETIGAIYICTHHDTHADLCIRAAKAGKHIMVEKPLALTVEECARVGRVVEETGITLMTAFKMRYYELILKAKELIPEPLMVSMQMMDNRWADDLWANDPVKGGGNILSQGCHSCDLLRYVAGADPVEVYAVGGNYYTATGVPDNLCAAFKFDNGAAASWMQGDANLQPSLSKFFMQLFAEGVSVCMTDRLCKLVVARKGHEPEEFSGTETGFLEENQAFIECLEQGKPATIDHRDGLLATLMALQAINSLKSGKPEPIKAVLEG